jgi:hypothetical protein
VPLSLLGGIGTTLILIPNEEIAELIARAKEKHRIFLMTRPNVIGMAIGPRKRKGEVVNELAVKVYVSKKLPEDHLLKEHIIPSVLEIENKQVHVDVE